MNADSTQAALPLPWFLGLIALSGLLIASGLLIERELRLRELRRRLDFERHCRQVLDIVTPRPVDELARRRAGGTR